MRYLPRGPIHGDRQQVECGQTPTARSTLHHVSQGGGRMSYPARGPHGDRRQRECGQTPNYGLCSTTSLKEAAA